MRARQSPVFVPPFFNDVNSQSRRRFGVQRTGALWDSLMGLNPTPHARAYAQWMQVEGGRRGREREKLTVDPLPPTPTPRFPPKIRRR